MREDEMSSGPLVVGKAVLRPVTPWIHCEPLGGMPLSEPQLKSKAMDADEIRRLYETGPRRITVDKRTHRIRFEGESEQEVTIVIEPK